MPQQTTVENTIYALGNRWNRLVDALPEWDAALAEARALWGDVLSRPANVILGKIGALQVNLSLYFQVSRGILRLEERDFRELQASIFAGEWLDGSGAKQPDAVAREIGEAVRDMEALLRPFIQTRAEHHAELS